MAGTPQGDGSSETSDRGNGDRPKFHGPKENPEADRRLGRGDRFPAGDGQAPRLEHEREEGSAGRDSLAKARDRAAAASDRAAEQLDRDLAWRESVGYAHGSGRGGRSERFNAGRRAAAEARGRAARDRLRAAKDRERAADYRVEAGEERAALLRQLAVSETDALTGARARAPGLADLESEINRARRVGNRLAVAYVDLVGLKAVNELHGHAGGDASLKAAVLVIRRHLRSYDVIIRIGGDEFVCVMSGATPDDARQRFASIRADAAASGLGIKFGIAALEPGDGPSELIERADSALPASFSLPVVPPRSAGLPVADLEQPRILVSDNRPEMAVIVTAALEERYRCEFAGNVDQAAEIVAGDDFDLLLCDLHRGGAAAMSLAKATIAGDLDTAVILLAEQDDPEAAQRAFELGAFGYVVRPLPGQLLITIMNALRRRELEIAHRELNRNLEEHRQAIIDMVPIAIYAKDRAGRYVVANAEAEAMARAQQIGMLGHTDEAFLPAEEVEIYTADDHRVMDEGSVLEGEDTVEIGGVTRTFKTVRFPLFDEAGGTVAVGGLAADITAEREAIRLRDKSIADLEFSRRETVERLSRAIDRHDASTGEHVYRLAALTAFLGAGLGLGSGAVELLRQAAPMHDVGKIGIPDEILRKSGPLSFEERAVMEQHTLIGHEILADSQSELLRIAATIALTHHERYDGSGYPKGLAGDDIPLAGRITAVADVFDALLSERAYRPALPVGEAVALLEEGRGTQFDPKVLDLLLDHLDEALALRGSG